MTDSSAASNERTPSEKRVLEMLRAANACAMRLDKTGWQQHLDAAGRAIDERACAGHEVRALRGEHLLVSAFRHSADLDAYLRTLREAYELIGGRSRALPRCCPMFQGFYSTFSVVNEKPGNATRNADTLEQAEEVFFKLTGGGRGTTLCYRAQMAFYRGDFDSARALGLQALDEAQANDQHTVSMCAAEVLANTSKHLEDHELWRYARTYLRSREYAPASTESDKMCRTLAQILDCTLDLSVGLLPDVPTWLHEGDFGGVPTAWGFQEMEGPVPAPIAHVALLARVEHLLYHKRSTMALAATRIMREVYGQRSVVLDAYAGFFSANAYLRLGEREHARAALREGVQAIAPDGLWVIAAEFVDLFGDLLYEEAARVDASAVETLRAMGEGYWKKLALMREDTISDAPEQLSDREHEVAELAVQGKSNAEIAEMLHLSVRTVRNHLENIYRKCSVSRRTQLADALQSTAVRTADWAQN